MEEQKGYPNQSIDMSVSISYVDNVYVRQMHFHKANAFMDGHKHTYNHLTLLGKGKIKVIVNDKETEYTAPHAIFIHKDFEHKLIALEDDTVAYCIHAVRDEAGDVLDPDTVPDGTKPFIA
jgi:quercetin dioxygenase-like cupin family protein